MVIAILVVAHGGHVHHGRDHVGRDDRTAPALLARLVTGNGTGRRLEDGEGLARVTASHAHDLGDRLVAGTHLTPEPMLGGERAAHEVVELCGFQRFKLDDDGTAQQRFDDREARVLGGRTDERDVAVLDGRQERVLLGFGEAMHLVDEQDGLLAFRDEPFVRAVKHGAPVLHAAGHGGQLLEHPAGLACDDRGERGLADAGRPEHDD